MARVAGIGGIFFKAQDAEALRAWYRTHLQLEIEEWGGMSDRPGGRADGAATRGMGRDDRVEESEFGRFGLVQDLEGNRVELWEPPKGRIPG